MEALIELIDGYSWLFGVAGILLVLAVIAGIWWDILRPPKDKDK
jgi:hypothetical protein